MKTFRYFLAIIFGITFLSNAKLSSILDGKPENFELINYERKLTVLNMPGYITNQISPKIQIFHPDNLYVILESHTLNPSAEATEESRNIITNILPQLHGKTFQVKKYTFWCNLPSDNNSWAINEYNFDSLDTQFHWAVRFGFKDLAQKYLELLRERCNKEYKNNPTYAHNKPLLTHDINGYNVLHIASLCSPQLIQWLLEEGADPNSRTSRPYGTSFDELHEEFTPIQLTL